MGNNQSADYESSSDYDADAQGSDVEQEDFPRSYSITPQIEPKDEAGDSQDDRELLEYVEGPATLGTNPNQVDEEQEDYGDFQISPQREKKKSKRVKRVEDYFQWDDLSMKQKDMYYDFVKTAKKQWSELGYEDDEVEKTVLNKIALLRF